MKKLLSYAVVLGLVMTGAALTSETQATCAFARTFNSVTGGYSYIFTPGVLAIPDVSSASTGNLIGSFWAMGNGVPGAVMNAGIDNGRFGALVAISPGYYYYGWLRNANGYPLYIQGPSWASSPDIDNCPDQVVGQKCMAMLLTDDVNGVGFFAFLTDEADAAGNYNFTQAGNLPINLSQVPKPAITGSTTIDAGNVDVILAGPLATEFAGGLYLDPACEPFGDITGYKVRSQTVPSGGTPPSDHFVANWTDVTPLGGVQALGTPSTVRVTCAGDSDVYLVTTLVFDSGFEFGQTSGNSGRVACGPTIADPEPINRKPGQRPARKTKR